MLLRPLHLGVAERVRFAMAGETVSSYLDARRHAMPTSWSLPGVTARRERKRSMRCVERKRVSGRRWKRVWT
jgi:hypothetical protein